MADDPTVPTLTDVATRLRRSEDEVRDAYHSEVADQAFRCTVEPYAWPLARAIHRRVARSLAMDALPLGVQIGDMNTTRIGSTDPEVRRLEGPYRRVTLG